MGWDSIDDLKDRWEEEDAERERVLRKRLGSERVTEKPVFPADDWIGVADHREIQKYEDTKELERLQNRKKPPQP